MTVFNELSDRSAATIRTVSDNSHWSSDIFQAMAAPEMGALILPFLFTGLLLLRSSSVDSQGLQIGFYDSYCADAEDIVRSTVEPTTGMPPSPLACSGYTFMTVLFRLVFIPLNKATDLTLW